MQFLILADDYKDTEALSRRLSVREEHLRRVRHAKAEEKFIIGGAKLSTENKMIGSMMLIEMESKEAAEQWISNDPYVTGKVWESIQILPFRVAEV